MNEHIWDWSYFIVKETITDASAINVKLFTSTGIRENVQNIFKATQS